MSSVGRGPAPPRPAGGPQPSQCPRVRHCDGDHGGETGCGQRDPFLCGGRDTQSPVCSRCAGGLDGGCCVRRSHFRRGRDHRHGVVAAEDRHVPGRCVVVGGHRRVLSRSLMAAGGGRGGRAVHKEQAEKHSAHRQQSGDTPPACRSAAHCHPPLSSLTRRRVLRQYPHRVRARLRAQHLAALYRAALKRAFGEGWFGTAVGERADGRAAPAPWGGGRRSRWSRGWASWGRAGRATGWLRCRRRSRCG